MCLYLPYIGRTYSMHKRNCWHLLDEDRNWRFYMVLKLWTYPFYCDCCTNQCTTDQRLSAVSITPKINLMHTEGKYGNRLVQITYQINIQPTGLKRTLWLLMQPQDWIEKDEQCFFLWSNRQASSMVLKMWTETLIVPN